MILIHKGTQEWLEAKRYAKEVTQVVEYSYGSNISKVDDFYWKNGSLWKTLDGYMLKFCSSLYFTWKK